MSGPYAWRCCDQRYKFVYGLVTDRQETVDAWREGGIEFQPLYACIPSTEQPDIEAIAREIVPYTGAIGIVCGEVAVYYSGFNLSEFVRRLLASRPPVGQTLREGA